MNTKRPSDGKKTVSDHITDGVSAALQSIPFTGGLAKYFDEYFPTHQKRMMQNFVETLHNHAENIDEIKCDVDELCALTSRIVLESVQTASAKRQEALRALLLNFASGKETAAHKVELFTQLVLRVTDLEMELLRLANRGPETLAREYGPPENRYNLAPQHPRVNSLLEGADKDMEMVAILDLVSLQLLQQPRTIRPDNDIESSELLITGLGREFLQWITMPTKKCT